MLKILSSAQIRQLDKFTIENEPISSIDLMERACQAFTQWFVQHIEPDRHVGVICGPGNNGGDGLGIARLLAASGYRTAVWLVKGGIAESSDFKTNLGRLPDEIVQHEISAQTDAIEFGSRQVLIDALFGSGLSRPVEGLFGSVIDAMNDSGKIVVAVDIPSGLYADKHSEGHVVRADYTITFQLPKLSFFMPENQDYVGRWEKVGIGLSKKFIEAEASDYFLLTRKGVSGLIPRRKKFSHKGDFGRALLIAGSEGKMGACILGARAAMRSGLGLLTVHVPGCGYDIIQGAVPEAMATIDEDNQWFSSPPSLTTYDALGIGPGLNTHSSTRKAFEKVLRTFEKPIVIDADALNLLAEDRSLLQLITPNSILTPHPGEFKRLAGDWKDDFERLKKAQEFARTTKTVLVLKGAHTMIIGPNGKTYFNNTGNPGMATGGSGDVLTGILTSLLAQRMAPIDAAMAGVYLHGLAGDQAALELGYNGLIASDIIAQLPSAFRYLFR